MKRNSMKKPRQKRFGAKRYPLYSLQITKDRYGTLHFHEVSNIKDGTEPFINDHMSMYKFGKELATSNLLTKGDKLALAQLFDGFNRNIT